MKNVYYVSVTFTLIADSPDEAQEEARSYLAVADGLIEREAVRGAVIDGTAMTRAEFPRDPSSPVYNVWTNDGDVDEWHDSKDEAVRDLFARGEQMPTGGTITLTEYPHRKENGDTDAQTFTQLLQWSKAPLPEVAP